MSRVTRKNAEFKDLPRYQLKVSLNEIRPPVWRRLVVPSVVRLSTLHAWLQAAMGWTDTHLHSFERGDRVIGPPEDDFDDGPDPDMEDERHVALAELLRKPGDRLRYTYDFGDGWDHAVVLERVLPPDPESPIPLVLDGRRACPPEDSGGPHRYAELLAIVADPQHPEHADSLEWLGGKFDPEAFDAHEINRIWHSVRALKEGRVSVRERKPSRSVTVRSSPAMPAERGLRVRPVSPPDVPRVWELLRGLAEYEKLTDVLTGNAAMLSDALFGTGHRLHGLVAQAGDRLVGYALYYPVFGSFRTRWRLWLEDLYVEPEARGTGAGVALMAELARLTLAGGYYSLDWEVLDWNRLALDFYERLGAHAIATDWLRYRLDGKALQAMAARPAPAARDR